MKNIILLLLLLVMLTVSCSTNIYKESQLEVGQSWIYIINKDNVFKEKYTKNNRIIAISGDYVQYIENDDDTLSCTKMWFVSGSTLLETTKKK